MWPFTKVKLPDDESYYQKMFERYLHQYLHTRSMLFDAWKQVSALNRALRKRNNEIRNLKRKLKS